MIRAVTLANLVMVLILYFGDIIHPTTFVCVCAQFCVLFLNTALFGRWLRSRGDVSFVFSKKKSLLCYCCHVHIPLRAHTHTHTHTRARARFNTK